MTSIENNNSVQNHKDKETSISFDEKEKLLKQNTKLRKENEHLLKMLDALPVMFCLLTPDYHLAYANKAFRERFGEVNGEHCYKHCFGLDKPCDFCQSFDVLKTGKPHVWQCKPPDGSDAIDTYDLPFKDIDGSPMIIEMQVDRSFKQKEIAEIKKHSETISNLNKKLQAQFEELEAIYSFSPVALFVLDDKLRFEKANKRFEEQVKIPSEKLLGMTIREILPGFADTCDALIKKVLATDKPVLNIEVSGKIPADPGIKKYFLLSLYPLKNIKKIIAVTQDITEQKQADKNNINRLHETIKKEEKHKLALELHDTVNQTLFSANMLSESISKSWNKNPQDAIKSLEKVRDLNRAAFLEARLLIYELMPEKIEQESLKSLIENWVKAVTLKYNIKFDLKLLEDYNLKDKTKQQIYRITQEAVNNIVKHSKAKKVEIFLKVNTKELKLVVSDNGIGFEVDNKNFEKKFGLKIMKDRAKKIKAQLDIESSIGSGTKITLSKN